MKYVGIYTLRVDTFLRFVVCINPVSTLVAAGKDEVNEILKLNYEQNRNSMPNFWDKLYKIIKRQTFFQKIY